MSVTLKDTTIRPVVFGISPNVEVIPNPKGQAVLKNRVSAQQFQLQETVLKTMAQTSRMIYCDSGILREVMLSPAYGTSDSASVNQLITQLDAKQGSLRRAPAPNGKEGRPMQSQVIQESSQTSKPLAKQVSSPDDVTFCVISGSALSSKNSFFQPTDAIVVFKGSSTLKNFKHDLYSQFTRGEISPGKFVPGSFLKHIRANLNVIQSTIREFAPTRLFITGHSLGGAQATLYAYQMLLNGVSTPLHLITFGSPTLMSDGARNQFNAYLDQGKITLDRVVSIFGKQTDTISAIPAGFSHPGYQPLRTELYPEAKGRAYNFTSIQKVQQQGGLFGIGSEKNQYETDTKTHMPNRVFVDTNIKAFPHAGQMGMTFLGAFRLVGMKNPGFTGNTFVANLQNDGVKFQQIPANPSLEVVPDASDNQQFAGRRKTLRNPRK